MIRLTLLAASLTLCSCAADARHLPVCDGRHLRPANPYGSILTAPAAAAAAAAAASDMPGGSGGCA